MYVSVGSIKCVDLTQWDGRVTRLRRRDVDVVVDCVDVTVSVIFARVVGELSLWVFFGQL